MGNLTRSSPLLGGPTTYNKLKIGEFETSNIDKMKNRTEIAFDHNQVVLIIVVRTMIGHSRTTKCLRKVLTRIYDNIYDDDEDDDGA